MVDTTISAWIKIICVNMKNYMNNKWMPWCVW
jgi:hypothetical protein